MKTSRRKGASQVTPASAKPCATRTRPASRSTSSTQGHQRQQQAGIEFERVVGRPFHVGDGTERATAFLLDPQADELEDVVGVLGRLRELVVATASVAPRDTGRSS